MSEQLYYTYSTIGSGSTTGERIRAQSPGIGSVTTEPVRALMRYLSYKLPIGADLRTSIEDAPISLVLTRTDYNRILSHRKYAGKDGVGRPGNLFTHAIINPEVISEQTGAIEPISARAAISLWRSPFWKTSEEQAPPKSTTIASLEPQALQQEYIDRTWPGKLTIASLQAQYPHCPTERQTAAYWLPQVFSAFLMLKKLNKTQLYIAAPAEMIATFIWSITRCLPRTLDIIQALTFSTYEREVGKVHLTITGTCWLPPANHNGPFIPQTDLPNSCYQENQPNLAINCYTQKQTPFATDEQVRNFVQFAIESLLQKNMAQLDQLIAQAERRGYQDFEELSILSRIQQEVPTMTVEHYPVATNSAPDNPDHPPYLVAHRQPQETPLSPRHSSQTVPANNTSQRSTLIPNKIKSLLTGRRPSKQDNTEDMIRTFNKAIKGKKAEKIAATYTDAIAKRPLTDQQRTVANMCKQLMEAYNAYINLPTSENQANFLNSYNAIYNSPYREEITVEHELYKLVERIWTSQKATKNN